MSLLVPVTFFIVCLFVCFSSQINSGSSRNLVVISVWKNSLAFLCFFLTSIIWYFASYFVAFPSLWFCLIFPYDSSQALNFWQKDQRCDDLSLCQGHMMYFIPFGDADFPLPMFVTTFPSGEKPGCPYPGCIHSLAQVWNT